MAFVTYNISTKYHSNDDFINMIREIVNYTYLDIEYDTKVEVKDIFNFNRFEVVASHKLNNKGFITSVEKRSDFQIIQVYTNIPVVNMIDIFINGRLQYAIERVEVMNNHELNEAEIELIEDLIENYKK